MTRDQVQVGQRVQVVASRWDVPIGTLARIDTVGSTADRWCFTVEWLTRASPLRRSYSLNLFEEDLACFQVFEGPVPAPTSFERPRRASAAARKDRPPQLLLPFADECADVRI